ncbi:reverse transcriptase domain-containing protein, partial [Tanacetum coccineum]
YPFSLNTAYSTSNIDTAYPGIIFREPLYRFNYPTRRLTIEEMLAKFIDEGVTTKGGKMTFEANRSKKINETGIKKNEPPRFEQDMPEKPQDDGVENKSSKEDLSLITSSRLENPHYGGVSERKFADESSSYEHLMALNPYSNIEYGVAGSEIPVNSSAIVSVDLPMGMIGDNVTAAKKVYESGFYCPSVFKDANEYVRGCDACQRLGNISSRNEMPQNNIQLFARFGVPKALISDRGTHFCNSQLEKALQRYGVTHKLSTAYHPQSNGQTKVTNRAIKRILERLVGYNPKGWSEKLNDALWAFRTTYKTPTGYTPFRLVYGKACHLLVEIEHKARWALKQCNMDLMLASGSRLMQLNELAELRDGAYENTRIYKERTKKWHDSRLCGDKDFKVGDQVLLYNSHLKMYPGKLKLKWSGPNIVKTVYPHGAIEITDRDGFSFKVNGQRLKKYYGGNIDKEDDEVIEFENGVT